MEGPLLGGTLEIWTFGTGGKNPADGLAGASKNQAPLRFSIQRIKIQKLGGFSWLFR